MKVLENSLVNLDIVPGQAQVDLQKKLREQGQSAVNDAGQFTKYGSFLFSIQGFFHVVSYFHFHLSCTFVQFPRILPLDKVM